MSILDKQPIFNIEESSLNFDDLTRNAPLEIAFGLKERSVVILPSHSHDDVFYAGTLETLDFLNENGINTDVYASDEEYKELGLHEAEIQLGTFVIQKNVIPVFCRVITSYIHDRLQAKDNEDIALTFIVPSKKGQATAVEFHGKVKNLNKVMTAIKELHYED